MDAVSGEAIGSDLEVLRGWFPSRTSVDDLGLREGQQAYAVVKASDVMVAID